MRILLLSTGGKIGGEETFTRNSALGLIERGHYVEMAVGGPVQREDAEKAGIRITEIDITGRSPKRIVCAARQLAHYATKNRFDIIHAQAVGPAIMGIIAKKFFGCRIPWIWHNHGITDFAYRFIVRHLNSLDRIIANSDYVREMLTGNGVKRDRIERIHNGIHIADYTVTEQERLDAREAVRKEFSLSADCRIITYVGRLSPEKGVEVLVDAFRTLCISTENVACLLVGDGVQREELQARINSYPCKEKIIFAGFRRDIKHLLAGSDVFVLPSHIETFSLSILQAFAAGTPCVASDVGGTPEQILPRLNGLLFQDNDSTELASRLNEILNDEEFRCYLTHNAIALSHSYLNDNRMIGDIENLYGRLISK